MYCMVIQKVDGEADEQDLKALQLSLGHRCDDLRLRGGIIRGKLLSPEHAHHAVLSLTRHHRYTQATNPWKIAIAVRASVAEEDLWLEAYQLARVCAPGHAIISEELYNELPSTYRHTYLLPEVVASYRVCRTVPRGQSRCFCILPIGSEDSPERRTSDFVFKRLITPACQELGYLPVHPLKQHGADVWSDIANSLQAFEHVVVYLGTQPYNPNVMLELGYRLATGKPVVVLASLSDSARLPFDLQNHRTIYLSVDPASMEQEKIAMVVQDIIAKMKDRAANDLGWGDLYATATIEIDTRNTVPLDLQDHKITDAAQQTADLFSIELPELIGMPPVEIMARVRELMEPKQYEAFESEQGQLYNALGANPVFARGSRHTVHARIPIVLTKHPDPKYFLRAYLPVVLSHEQIGNRSLQRVVYVDVSRSIKRDQQGIYYVPQPAPNLDFVFAQYAHAYDTVLLHLPNYKAVVEQHCTLIKPHGSMKVLDLGAGTGNLTVRLLDAGAHVTAVDRSPEMLNVLRRKCQGKDYQDRLKRYALDCSNLAWLDSRSFDVVNILLVLFSVDEAVRVLQEAVRVLRPGGMLIVTEPNQTFNIERLLYETETYLHSTGHLESMQAQWGLVKQVNLAFQTALSTGWKAENVEESLLHSFGWDDDNFTRLDAYQGQCTTLQAIKPDDRR